MLFTPPAKCQLSGIRYGSLKRSKPRGGCQSKGGSAYEAYAFCRCRSGARRADGGVGAQRRAAGVPSEVVQLITGVGHVIPSWSES